MVSIVSLLPLLIIIAVIVVVVAIRKGSKQKPTDPVFFTPPPPMNGCVRCGHPLQPGVTFCPSCGMQVAASTPTVSPEEQRQKTEIASLSTEEVRRRYCDVDGYGDAYRYWCYEELTKRKGNNT